MHMHLELLIALQVLGLNALAWRERSALNAQQDSLQSILTTTFPSVSLVIDAPLQMQREIDALQQKSGAVSSTDCEPLLAALAGVFLGVWIPSGVQDFTRRAHDDIHRTGLSPLSCHQPRPGAAPG